jgi:hypothetical protein
MENNSAQLRRDLIVLVESQRSMMVLRELLDQRDEVANKVSDVWNSILDLREVLIERIVNNPLMQVGGCMEALCTRVQQQQRGRNHPDFISL